MTGVKGMAKVLALVFLINLFAAGVSFTYEASAASEPLWEQAVIDAAVAEKPQSMHIGNFEWGNTLKVSQAMYILALMSYYNPDLAASDGTKVSVRLHDHITMITSPGKEPTCRGSLGGWVDNPVAQALALAKNTPAVWNELSVSEKERCDFIMQCMTVVGNITQNSQSNPRTDMSQTYDWQKGYNPNMQEGYVGVMIAAYFYFGGADEVNAMLADFKYDEYLAKMDEYGFTNVKGYYEKVGKDLMEKGGPDAKGGMLCSARKPFTFSHSSNRSEVAYEPMALYSALASKMWDKEVKSQVKKGDEIVGYIKDGSISPYEGQMGMGHEFQGTDGGGIRTSANYINLCIRNCIPTRATIEAFGYWKGDDVADTEKRMFVGMEDWLFKISDEHGGWVGYDKGQAKGALNETYFKEQGQGYQYFIEVWNKLLKREVSANGTYSESGNTITGDIVYRNIGLEPENLISIVLVYDKEGRLCSMNSEPITLEPSGEATSSFKLARPGRDCFLKMFQYSDDTGAQEIIPEVR